MGPQLDEEEAPAWPVHSAKTTAHLLVRYSICNIDDVAFRHDLECNFQLNVLTGEEMCTDWMKKKLESAKQPKTQSLKMTSETADAEAAK